MCPDISRGCCARFQIAVPRRWWWVSRHRICGDPWGWAAGAGGEWQWVPTRWPPPWRREAKRRPRPCCAGEFSNPLTSPPSPGYARGSGSLAPIRMEIYYAVTLFKMNQKKNLTVWPNLRMKVGYLFWNQNDWLFVAENQFSKKFFSKSILIFKRSLEIRTWLNTLKEFFWWKECSTGCENLFQIRYMEHNEELWYGCS